ncbi:uncharacterized protein N7496_001052 [Penicillium cataractarum]|uniref:Kinesin-like protein n=1 Tax=Penicillium cataractarum TaxID=2100454 RepID=A0A9W9VVL4_9EURO|nr:uncharacterized protein N7496_001052 [Penicillium cataractarum]KAJ5389984.1 hypothetical protein N7496_001052 [Penicillium cataractarum]
MQPFRVFARWRNLSADETDHGEIQHEITPNNSTLSSMSIATPSQSKSLSNRDQSWKSQPSMTGIFEVNDNNETVFNAVVAPILPRVLQGKSSNFFAYGHSGSGKTHTIIGYDYENTEKLGLCLASARHLMQELARLNGNDTSDQLGIGIRMYELRKNSAFDLLNDRCECFVREGSDGQVYIRGKTEMLEDGKVRVRPIVTKACWNFEDLSRELQIGLQLRATGTSTVHDQSSRTHAVIELEIVTKELLEARDAIVERQSELVPVGKYATDVYLEEQIRAVVLDEQGKYVPNPEYQVDQEHIDAAEARKAEFEARVKSAEEHESGLFQSISRRHACLGGKLVFVDLAGSEYYDAKNGSRPNQTPQEKQEGRQINTDLLALKEVIRARAQNLARVPFRSSPLTMVLRQHFQASSDTDSAMILTISPSAKEFAATMNTLKYGSLVGVAGDKK